VSPRDTPHAGAGAGDQAGRHADAPSIDAEVWAAVAAPGTDPTRLGQVVTRRCADGAAAVAERLRSLGRTHAGPRAVWDAYLGAPTAASTPTLEGIDEHDAEAEASERARTHARTWRSLDVRVALAGDPGYPARLATGWPTDGAPPLVAWRGRAPGAEDRPRVAIVGARRASSYGTGVAAWLAEAASTSGIEVVSGGAVGVDAAAHAAALDGPGGTTVVLGCGHDVAYPRPHAIEGGLFDRVLAAGGALVSESLPGDAPRAHRVRARNRIVAGLVDAVVVVEGGARSGALVTAGDAADRGVAVLAVPGDVTAPLSTAPHRLLTEGAAPCTGPDDLLAAVGRLSLGSEPDGRPPTVLPPPVRAVLDRRWPRPVRPDDLARTADVAIGSLLAALTRARIAGEVVESPDGVRLARAP
jgi:DNA processing protein